MRKIFFSIALLGMLVPATAQELYMPRNIKKAYANGTRDLSGAPGKNYWQNKGIYDIQIKVMQIPKLFRVAKLFCMTTTARISLIFWQFALSITCTSHSRHVQDLYRKIS